MRAVVLLAVLLLAACDRGGTKVDGVVQTKAPGHVAAGGKTSGEVIAASPQGEKPGTSGPAGTPGIPKGAEGNVGGAAPGGAPGQQPTANVPPPPVRSEKAGTAPASEDVKTGAQPQPPGVRADAPDKAGQK
jgi:hypothetical protein